MTQAILKSKDTLFLLFERPHEAIVQLIKDLHALFMGATEPIRPGVNSKGSIRSTHGSTTWGISLAANFMTLCYDPTIKQGVGNT